MKKMFLLVLLLPVLVMAQNKNVVQANRVFPKPDKVAEFEKGLAAHAQKYHTGDWKWRVFEIQTGPDAGGYHITEGPLAWETFDGRGDLGTEHTNDWNKNIAVYTTDRGSVTFSVFRENMSTVGITDYADKIIINHMYPKPGYLGNVRDMVMKMKKAWTLGNESVAVYESAVSGEPQIVTVTRLKGGLKELATGFRKPMDERYNEANGAGSWDYYLADYAKYVERRWSELLYLRTDLSSK